MRKSKRWRKRKERKRGGGGGRGGRRLVHTVRLCADPHMHTRAFRQSAGSRY